MNNQIIINTNIDNNQTGVVTQEPGLSGVRNQTNNLSVSGSVYTMMAKVEKASFSLHIDLLSRLKKDFFLP